MTDEELGAVLNLYREVAQKLGLQKEFIRITEAVRLHVKAELKKEKLTNDN